MQPLFKMLCLISINVLCFISMSSLSILCSAVILMKLSIMTLTITFSIDEE